MTGDRPMPMFHVVMTTFPAPGPWHVRVVRLANVALDASEPGVRPMVGAERCHDVALGLALD